MPRRQPQLTSFFVVTEEVKSHTITFNGNYTRLNLKANASGTTFSPTNTDSTDRITFNGNINKSTITTGNSASEAGDVITFNQNITNSTITARDNNRSDSVIFATHNTGGSTLNVGNSGDSISLQSSTKVAANITLNLGADAATDTIRVADVTTFKEPLKNPLKSDQFSN